MSRAARWGLVAAALGLLSCESATPTQLLVVVDSDFGSELDEIELRAELAGQAPGRLSARPRDVPLPLSFSLLHDGGMLGPLLVTVQGRRGSEVLVSRSALTVFEAGQVRVLRMDLFAQCAAVVCAEGATCTEAGCVPLAQAGEAREPWPGRVGPRPLPTWDARPPDSLAPPDGDVPDAGIVADGAPPNPDSRDGAETPDGGAPPSADLGPCSLFPDNAVWRRDVRASPVSLRSPAYMAALAGRRVKALVGPSQGVPWRSVDERTGQVGVSLETPGVKSDWPVPLDFPLDAAPDQRLIVVDTSRCLLLEALACVRVSQTFQCATGGVVALNASWVRQRGSVMATDSALALLPGMIRYQEAAERQIEHAIALSLDRIQAGYVSPALNHLGGTSSDPSLPPMGARLRLRADYPDTALGPEVRAILRALKTYGALLTHRGPAMGIYGDTHAGWAGIDLSALGALAVEDFEVLDHEAIVK